MFKAIAIALVGSPLFTVLRASPLLPRQSSQLIVKQFTAFPPGSVIISQNTSTIGFQFDPSSGDACFFSNPDPAQFIPDSDHNLVQYRIVMSTAQYVQAQQENLQIGASGDCGSGTTGPTFELPTLPPGFDPNTPFTQITIGTQRCTGKESDRKLVSVGVQIQNSAGTQSICSGQFNVGQAGAGDSQKDCAGTTTLNPLFIDLVSSCGQVLSAPGVTGQSFFSGTTSIV